MYLCLVNIHNIAASISIAAGRRVAGSEAMSCQALSLHAVWNWNMEIGKRGGKASDWRWKGVESEMSYVAAAVRLAAEKNK